ncbi:hypothetical protein FOL47_008464 [Perkinsus chesapeaki]|uniref:Parkin coregulated protein n=1 Tax=Perkinsus chesapeaki TaxID=330153 RepID=A0A7J6LDR9_PERCH|nr:hypothetical protein FOL47_008464 [Perkinsus chesapeaki]
MTATVPVVPSLTLPLLSPRKEPVVATHRPCEIIPVEESVGRVGAATSRVKSARQRFHRTPRRADEAAVTAFQAYYSRAGLPFRIKHGTRKSIRWEMPPDTIDYSVVLPVFVDGLREVSQPYDFMAYEGALELVRRGGDDRVLPVIPKLILPLKRALNSKDPRVMRKALHLLQVLVRSGELIGEALVPYYRQLLPIFNVFKKQKNMGDYIDFRFKRNIGALIEETLVVLETHGGEDEVATTAREAGGRG